MVYALNNIDFQTVVCDYGALFGKDDIVLLGNNIFPEMNIFSETHGRSAILTSLMRLSLDKSIVIILATTIVNDNVAYNSALVVDKGAFVGICDEIFTEKFARGNAIFYFCASVGKIAIILGGDILFAQVWSHFLGKDIVKIFHISDGEFCSSMLNMAQAVAIAVGCPVFSNFRNISISVDNTGKIVQMEIGILRPFIRRPSSGREYYTRKILPVIEEKANVER